MAIAATEKIAQAVPLIAILVLGHATLVVRNVKIQDLAAGRKLNRKLADSLLNQLIFIRAEIKTRSF
jgi:hypothetical protein